MDEKKPHCDAPTTSPCNLTYEFNCQESFARCIPLQWKCDGEEDCDGGIDEHGCHGSPTPGPAPTQSGSATKPPVTLPPVPVILQCGDREFKCLDGDRCIPYSHRCDSFVNCKDGSDENKEACKTAPRCAPKLHFSCVTTPQCIPWSQHCDGTDDCGDNSDEYACELTNAPPFFACEGMFRCGSGKCLSFKRVCDGKPHCKDGSDEHKCSIDECTDGTHDCVGNQKCVDLPTGYDCQCQWIQDHQHRM
eukprot:m.287137 g.287137  ORF g.287137 m.287137 type:complete len:248 (+) comp40702_c0_seq1:880-1623(+)